jgi:hypothetical protein
MNIDLIAEVCHEANRVLQRAGGEVVHFPWENTTEVLRASIRSGVGGVLDGLSPEESHQAWVEYKVAEGWVYGPVKDFAAKTHPNLVPYSELPFEQRLKDRLFGTIVEAFRQHELAVAAH